MNRNDGFQPYLARLRELPFVKRANVRQIGASEPVLSVDTPTASQSFILAHVRSHLARSDVELWAGRARTRPSSQPLLLVTPYVSGPMGARLREAGIRYLDAAGNVSLTIDGPQGPQHVALVQGNVPPQTHAAERAWRAPSYQVLFTLLVHPSLLQAPLRQVATEAEVSTTPVLQVRAKLVQLGLAVKVKSGLQWVPGALPKAREIWLRGYQATLRPSLLLQRYRPRQALEIPALEEELSTGLDPLCSWRWGGAAAAYRIDPYYRGETTVVHVDLPPGTSLSTLHGALRMIPDPVGPVVILRRPGALAFDLGRAFVTLPPLTELPHALTHTVQLRTVHPLLVWAELLEEGHDRASEAAEELARDLLNGDDDARP